MLISRLRAGETNLALLIQPMKSIDNRLNAEGVLRQKLDSNIVH